MQNVQSTVATTEGPHLRWKATLRKERPLERLGNGSEFPTLTEVFDFIAQRKGGRVLVFTRTPDGWTIYEYKGFWLCKVDFKELQIAGLPLGGDPLTPHTYIVDGRGRLARIVRNQNRYELKPTDRPTQEPTGPWINAIVPVEEHNDGRFLTWLPNITLRPSLDELQSMQVWINENFPAKTKMKAGGSQHAWSQIANTDSIYVQHDRLKMFRGIDEDLDVYRADLGDRRRNLVRAGSGGKTREANHYLWQNGKAFKALGGYDAQTMGGLFNTGTHGSVFTVSPLAEFIVSIDLLRANATFVRIEPKDGITDRDALARERPDLELIQDDDYFHANLINIGTMGIVHSYVLEVTESFHLEEIRTATTIADLKRKLAGGKIYELAGVEGKPADLEKVKPRISKGDDGGFAGHPFPAYHIEFLFNPHGTKVIITSRHPIQLRDEAILGFEPPGRDLIRTLLMRAQFKRPVSRPVLTTWFQENFRQLLVFSLDTITHLLPITIPLLIDQAMNTLVEKDYSERSFNVFNIGEGTNRIPALAGSIFVPLEDDMYLGALDVILATAKRLSKRKKYETAPVSMRFVRGTKALLGCPKDYCSFECVFTSSTKYALEMFEAYAKALWEKYGNEVRLHWGQMLPEFKPEQIRGMYPGYDRWRTIRDELDPDARFLNAWQSKNLPPINA